MAIRGTASKKQVEAKLLEVFPEAFMYDKCIYINCVEDGEPVQIKVALTAPKTLVEGGVRPATSTTFDCNGGVDFSKYVPKPAAKPQIEFTEEEKKIVEKLSSFLDDF